MKAWKQWTLYVFLAMGMSCDWGGISVDGGECGANHTACGAECCDNATHVCNTDISTCEFGTTPGECEGIANDMVCADGGGLCYEEVCETPDYVLCANDETLCAGDNVSAKLGAAIQTLGKLVISQ